MQVTRTLKLKFHRLNVVKASMFAETTIACTELANELLKLPIKERKKLTTAKVVTPLKSALANQVIRQVSGNAGKRTKEFKLLPPEVNYQNWQLYKKGDTYSVSFPTIKRVKRVPIEIKSNHWQLLIDRLLEGDNKISKGTLKLYSKKGKWYALIGLSEEVPDKQSDNRIGVDRGQNLLATAVPKQGFGLLFSGKQVKHRRRVFQKRRQLLQKSKKYRAVRKLEQKENRWMRAVNHTVSRRIVNFADRLDADLVLEDLSGCRKTMKQSKKSRSDNAESRHAWAYYDLQTKLEYKQAMNGRLVHYRPAHYTSRTSSINGILGTRSGNWFKCTSGTTLQADFNAGRNLAIWDYRSCPIDSRESESVMDSDNMLGGVIGSPPNLMNAVQGRAEYVQPSLFDCTSY
ncbi:MAG: IS200/IS605 family element transposase accessory protein TnpB [Chlorogloeopsis fritschii C42_A2020_084]|uniref:RNA-guided endonuclease InsQ/TnpB family protein n=1 Tax=Chlorogloeopsis fritschii TaxID=1124 RepID=UPI0019E45172|nr:transposase [Chlorogloeopsis fritschii]MBF2008363.1 IS200/IS605 family element transposase accessory protein TnpB [Chlorogloeopsis fritschii C42_A2020_084]